MNVRQIESLSDEQREELYHLFQDEWWTEGRDRETIETMCSESDLLVAFCDDETDDLVAFARVLTDTVYKALIFDVVVAPAYRGEGLGSLLMDAIVEHPELAAVDQFELYCRESMIPFYDQWEFTDDLGDLHLLRRE